MRERGELPAVTDWLLWLSHTLQSYGLFIAAGLVVAVFVIRSRLATEEGRVWLDRWRLKVPVVSGIYLSLAVSRFCRVLGTLLTGGVPIVRSLEISADSTGNRVLSAADPRGGREHFGRPGAGPAARGQRPFSGRRRRNDRRRPSNRIAWKPCCPTSPNTLERDTWRRLDLFVRLLEPLMLLLLAGVVLLVVIALLGAGAENEQRGLRLRTIGGTNCSCTFSEEYRSMNDPIKYLSPPPGPAPLGLHVDGSAAGARDPGRAGVDGRARFSAARRSGHSTMPPRPRSASSKGR